jgi:hypothetical protein
MKKMHGLSVLLFAGLLVAGCSKDSGLKTTPPIMKFYGIQSARIEYEYSGKAKGTKTTMFANWGMYQSDEDNIIMDQSGTGKSDTVHNISLLCDTLQYMLDMKTKKGQKMPITTEQFKQLVSMLPKDYKDNYAEFDLAQKGATKTGKETILGKECDIYEMMGQAKFWFWKGINLKQEITMGEHKITLIAKKIDTDPGLNISDFTPPEEVKVTDMSKGLPAGHPPVDEQNPGTK